MAAATTSSQMLSPQGFAARTNPISGMAAVKGAQAEHVVTPVESVARIPGDADLIAWSTLLMNALTARMALDELGPHAGTSVAVTGAVGTYVAQLTVPRGLVAIADAADKDREFLQAWGVRSAVDRDRDFTEQSAACSPQGWTESSTLSLSMTTFIGAFRDGAKIASLRGHQGSTDRGVRWTFPFVSHR